MVVSLNLSDVARKRGLNIDAAKLSELLDATCFGNSCSERVGCTGCTRSRGEAAAQTLFPANPPLPNARSMRWIATSFIKKSNS